jgi:hypothetical protein
MRSTDPPRATSFDPSPGPTASVRLICDPERFDFYIEADPGYRPVDMARVCAEAVRQGLVADDFDDANFDECTAVLAERTTRIVLRPTDPAMKARYPW